MRGERRSAARAVRHYLVAFVYQTAVEYALEAPPLRLDVLVVVGDVRVLHVRPIAHLVAHLLPEALVLPDALLTLLYERLDAVFFYLVLAVQAEGFLHLQLYGQTVRVPARFTQDVAALHRAVSGDDVLHDARQDVADVRLAVRGGRSVVKRELFPAFAALDALLKDLVVFPELADLFLAIDEVETAVYLPIHIYLRKNFFPLTVTAYRSIRRLSSARCPRARTDAISRGCTATDAACTPPAPACTPGLRPGAGRTRPRLWRGTDGIS